MPESNYIHLDVEEVLKESDKAFLLLLEDGEEIWTPKSVVSDSGTYSAGDRNLTVSVSEWWAKDRGIG